MDNKFGNIVVNLGNVIIDLYENNWYYKYIPVTGIPNGARLISCIKMAYNANVMISVSSENVVLQSPVKVTLPANRGVIVIWAKVF